MGCFVSCFRSRDRDRKVRSRPGSLSNLDSYYDLESLEERLVVDNQLASLFLNEENLGLAPTLDEELRQEAKHLKLCGAIPETPMEIRKSSRRMALQELNGLDQSSRSFDTSNKKIQLSEQFELENSISPDQAITGSPGTGSHKTPGTRSAEEMRGRNLKLTPVRYGLRARASNLNSPYPTPITLTEDMQTPATIYSSYQETSVTGKRASIRAQFVYPELKHTREADISKNMVSIELDKENEVAGEFSFGTKQNSEETPKVLVSDLSEWLKPTSSLRGRNGIPNSTSKYNEDQQVKWHATPFEERLEKVLSDEKLSPRKLRVAD